jgi:hypothetical protein
MLDELRPVDEEARAVDREEAEPPMLTKQEAIDEVKRWFRTVQDRPRPDLRQIQADHYGTET